MKRRNLVVVGVTATGCGSIVWALISLAGVGGTRSLAFTPPRGLPKWVPQPGQIANISLNTIANVNPCPARPCFYSGTEGQSGVFDWCGGGYIPDVGAYGKLSMWGGGHEAYYGNEVYEFDFETRLWTRLKDPYPANKNTPINDWGEHTDPVNPDDPVEPAAPHSYRQVLGLPSSVGGGPGGSTVQMHLSAIGRGAIGRSGAHIFDHATKLWKRWGQAKPPTEAGSLAYKPFALDVKRACVWGMGGLGISTHGARMLKFDIPTKTWSYYVTPLSALPFIYFGGAGYTCIDYCPTLDVLVAVEVYTRPASSANPIVCTLSCSNPTEGWRARPTTTFSGSIHSAYSINWADSHGKFGVYSAGGDNIVHYLKPPPAVEGTWEWSSETFSGATPAWQPPRMRASYNRFNWIEPLRCWAWYHGVTSPVQLWRPMGT